MKRIIPLAIVLLISRPVLANDHLVSPTDVQARLEQHARAHAAALDSLEARLAAPPVAAALSRSGLKPADVRAGLALLGEDELQDLHRRSEALRSDPAAAGAGNVAGGFLLGVLAGLAFWLWVASHLEDY